MNELIQKNEIVTIQDKEYKLRELSLSEKIKVLGIVGDLIRDITKNVFFQKNENNKISVIWNDQVSFAELNIDRIILSSVQALPEILALSVPDFKDWDNLPESQSRDVLKKVLALNDFTGFVLNFISLATAIIH